MSTSTSKPNILFLVSDQHQARLLGCAGHEEVKTPNLDWLAARGVNCRHAYTTNPICTPSRVSMLSGQYPHNHGYFGLSGPKPGNLPNLFRHVRRNGYRTAGIGKLHLPDDPENWVAADLDFFGDCYRDAKANRYNSPYHQYLKSEGVFDLEDSRNIPDENGGFNAFDARPTKMKKEHVVEYWCVREALRFIEESGEEPWCMQVSFPRPHHQLTPLPEFWEMYEGVKLPNYYLQSDGDRPPHFREVQEKWREYQFPFGNGEDDGYIAGMTRSYRGTMACISMVDDAIGDILRPLEEKGILDNTIVVYTSDHGAYHGMFGVAEKYPGICSEEVCRIPMIWSFPSQLDQRETHHGFVENVDILPTLFSLANLPELDTTDGVDRSSALNQMEAIDEDAIAVTENEWSKAIRWQDFRLVYYPAPMFKGKEFGELYQLSKDPWETKNLYNDNKFKVIREKMERLLLDWLICSSRHITSHPPTSRNAQGNEVFILGEDRKESNLAGPHLRVKRGQLNYL